MPIIWINVEEVQFDVAFGAEEDLLASVGALADIVPFEFIGKTYQGSCDVEEIALGEMVFCYFFLLDGLLKGEVVVVDVAVEHLVFDAKLCIWIGTIIPSLT